VRSVGVAFVSGMEVSLRVKQIEHRDPCQGADPFGELFRKAPLARKNLRQVGFRDIQLMGQLPARKTFFLFVFDQIRHLCSQPLVIYSHSTKVLSRDIFVNYELFIFPLEVSRFANL